MLCKKLHHAAYRCKDARETTEFYTKILGLKFSHAMGEDHVPSTGLYSPHVHIFFELEDGSNIAFFEVPEAPGHMRDMEMPDWIQHFAFEVESVQALLKAKQDLERKGLKVVGPTNHDDFLLSIYFFDPSGHGWNSPHGCAVPSGMGNSSARRRRCSSFGSRLTTGRSVKSSLALRTAMPASPR